MGTALATIVLVVENVLARRKVKVAESTGEEVEERRMEQYTVEDLEQYSVEEFITQVRN